MWYMVLHHTGNQNNTSLEYLWNIPQEKKKLIKFSL